MAQLTPCSQGCCNTWLALRRFLASRTRSLDIRSLALEEMWAQSFSGNSYFASWMLSNKVFWKWKNNSVIFVGSYFSALIVSRSKGYLTDVTGFSQFPSTVATTAAYEGWIPAQHDVEDHSEAPQVAALVIDCRLFAEGLNDFRRHVFCWATLKETISLVNNAGLSGSFTQQQQQTELW